MLALAVMPVVFVLGEQISQGTSLYVTAVKRAKSLICFSRPESATVTKFLWKRKKWNAVNPTS